MLLLNVLLFNRLLSMSFLKFLRFNWLKRNGLSISNIALLKNCCCYCPSSSSSSYSPWKLINNFNRLSTNASSSSSFSSTSILLSISHINILPYHSYTSIIAIISCIVNYQTLNIFKYVLPIRFLMTFYCRSIFILYSYSL